ncbi:Dam family site-specific DNA-(adenine-N6)-methyltransferase [Sediminibacterium roseum]|uniref:Site-specific DNA-methyltransferase (adenine-specific) n=1 Tax=Sediminibacterium roseum TaxID=1978412 RepID=A0ABW9ZXY5_9BACT|nr:Dam family site-specific DNA-(adenine-N6)-methyltransferase [Sediminibacterium roseum]NCI51375.1 Dam family site-specific DNA-(adenine-N6)-methyltransferase [Sediminibacterium roseum]
MPVDETIDQYTPPFLRWTGSKRWFTRDYLDEFLPDFFNNYHEPFLGGGAVFFHLKNHSQKKTRRYYLSDSNEELINCYVQLKDNVDRVLYYLKQFKNSEQEYYKIRSVESKSNAKRAARFIYLNRTSFNGIYRVNCYGQYNVPYGKRTAVDVVTSELFNDVHSFLQGVWLKTCPFTKTLANIKKNDLVFIDPPYTVAHENNGFIEYNQKLFSWQDQLKLKEFVHSIIDIGAYFILTNASHASIRSLYSGTGVVGTLSRSSQVGGRNKTRGLFNELVITNTKPF